MIFYMCCSIYNKNKNTRFPWWFNIEVLQMISCLILNSTLNRTNIYHLIEQFRQNAMGKEGVNLLYTCKGMYWSIHVLQVAMCLAMWLTDLQIYTYPTSTCIQGFTQLTAYKRKAKHTSKFSRHNSLEDVFLVCLFCL